MRHDRLTITIRKFLSLLFFAIVKFRDILSVKSKWPDIIRTYVLSGNVPTNGVAIKLLIVIKYM